MSSRAEPGLHRLLLKGLRRFRPPPAKGPHRVAGDTHPQIAFVFAEIMSPTANTTKMTAAEMIAVMIFFSFCFEIGGNRDDGVN